MKTVDIQIEKMAYGAKGLGFDGGKAVFVPGTVAGEKVRVRLVREKDSWAEAELLEVLSASPERVKPSCPYTAHCGGCQYQHMSYAEELRSKQAQAVEALGRLKGLASSLLIHPIAASDTPWRYRNQITLHAPDKRGSTALRLGYLGHDNKTLAVVEDCLIADERLQSAFVTPVTAASLRTCKDITFRVDQNGRAVSNLDDSNMSLKLLGRTVVSHSQAFFQNNLAMTERLIWRMRELPGIGGKKALFDLYSGVGIFGLFLEDQAESVYAFEENRQALDCLKVNFASKPRKLALAQAGKVEKGFVDYFGRGGFSPYLVILDPPRQGIERSLAQYLSGIEGQGDLVYVSCELGTLTRDLEHILAAGRWEPVSGQVFDMFPRTRHMEIMIHLKRKE